MASSGVRECHRCWKTVDLVLGKAEGEIWSRNLRSLQYLGIQKATQTARSAISVDATLSEHRILHSIQSVLLASMD